MGGGGVLQAAARSAPAARRNHSLRFCLARPRPPPTPPHPPPTRAGGTHPCDLLLLMACSEGDDGKVAELLEAGADPSVKVRAGPGRAGLGWAAGRMPWWRGGLACRG